MKKSIAFVAMCATALSPMTPAFAQDEMFTTMAAPSPPAFVDPYPELSEICADAQKPNVKSGFSSVAINVDEGARRQTTVDDPNGTPSTVGNGTPVIEKLFARAHVNGQSVNIHADITEKATYASSTTTIPTIVTTITETTFDCHVHKAVNGNGTGDDEEHSGFNLSPNGLQRGLSVETSRSTAPSIRTTPGPAPFVVFFRDGEAGVICISPSKPTPKGTWRGQNGYTNQLGRECSTAWHNELGSSQPTASLPPA